MKKQARGVFSLFLSAAIYGSFGVLIQWMNGEMLVLNQIIFRYFLAVLLLLLILAILTSATQKSEIGGFA